MRLLPTLLLAAGLGLGGGADAAIVNVDMSGAVSGTTVTGTGASFARAFAGQSVSGNDLSGSPTGPLALQPLNTVEVAPFNPVVSPASNSLFDFDQPLAMLLDSDADSLTLTMGF